MEFRLYSAAASGNLRETWKTKSFEKYISVIGDPQLVLILVIVLVHKII